MVQDVAIAVAGPGTRTELSIPGGTVSPCSWLLKSGNSRDFAHAGKTGYNSNNHITYCKMLFITQGRTRKQITTWMK